MPRTTTHLYELIRNIGINSYDDVAKISGFGLKDFELIHSQISDIYQTIEEDIDHLKSNKNIFKVIPGGLMNIESEFVCSDPSCRAKAIKSACKKMLFHSDVIIMNDILLGALEDILREKPNIEDINKFQEALIIMLMIKPLADQNMILFIPSVNLLNKCSSCINDIVREAKIDIDRACMIYAKNNIVSVEEISPGDYSIAFSGKTDGHKLYQEANKLPLSIIRNVKRTGSYVLKSNEVKNYEQVVAKVSKICLQLNWKASLAEKIEGSFVTDSQCEWDLIDIQPGIPTWKEKEYNFEIPYIEEASLEDLIAIRNSSPSSF